MARDERQQPQTHRIAEGLEHPGEVDGAIARQGLAYERRAAGVVTREILIRHTSILTDVESTDGSGW